MSLAIDIANAVAAELNAAAAGTFSDDFAAVRRAMPRTDISSLTALTVSVVPQSVSITAASRIASTHEIAVDIGVQKKVGNDVDADVAALCLLTQEIGMHLARRQLTNAPYAAWTGYENDPIYAQEHLAAYRVFTGVLTITYRVMR